MTETINGVPLELLKRAVQIPSKASVEENHAAIVDRGRAQAELRDMLYAAPVSEAKAQGVVMPERWNVPRPMWKDARQPYGNPLNHADIEAAEKFNLALDEVARLNAAPVQQVVPDGSRLVTTDWLKRIHRDLDACQKLIWANMRGCDPSYYEDAQERLREIDAMLAAAPSAPAADAGLVEALCHISLCSNNSMSSKADCGKIARAALAAHRAQGVV